MPCHRCGARQTDPVRGASPWRRGVRRGEQVLVCPECQSGRDWSAELSHCASCGSARLVRMLGTTECKDCGAQDEVAAEPETTGEGSDPAPSAAALAPSEPSTSSTQSVTRSAQGGSTLADDVRAALERQFGAK